MSSLPVLPGLQVERVLARGGTSVVYLARQEELDRSVAVKVLNAEVDDARAWRAFQREARAAGQLSGHANVVTVYTTGHTADGRPFLVSEYLDGGSLADLVATSGPLPWPTAARIGVAVADALAAAHAVGIVHRDVKPANVLLDRHGRVKLADFGITRLLAAQAHTTTGSIAFTPQHVAPEVLRGAPVGPAIDVYGLASTVYTALTGRPPHAGPPGEPIDALLARKLLAEPPAMPPSLPPALASVLRAALAPDPAARPPLGALRSALADAAHGKATAPAGRAAGAGLAAAAAAGGVAPAGVDPTVVRAAAPATTTVRSDGPGGDRRGAGIASAGAAAAMRRPPANPQDVRDAAASHRRRRWLPLLAALAVLAALIAAAVLVRRATDHGAAGRTAGTATTLAPVTATPTTAAAAAPTTAAPPTTTPHATAAPTTRAPSTTTPRTTTAPTTTVPPTTAPPTTAPPATTAAGVPAGFDAPTFVQSYYGALAARDYQTAWSMLAPEFQVANPRSYPDYVRFWNAVDVIQVRSVQVVPSGTPGTVVSDLTMHYQQGGRATDEVDQITIRFDANGTPLISSYRVLRVL